VIHRLALHVRVSMHEQNADMQLIELRSYAQLRGWTIAGEFVHLGISGAKDSRPALNKMIAAAPAREVDAVFCWKIDRLGRSLTPLVTTIHDLQAYGVAFISLRDDIDLSTPAGKLMFHVISAMAEFERSLIVSRVHAGIEAARSRGVRFGRPKVWVSADKVAALREAGVPWVAVAKKLGVGKGTCQRALACPERIGSLTRRAIPRRGSCPRLSKSRTATSPGNK
jgi:DNA invertase Pin-like site-specific DNA recombinase